MQVTQVPPRAPADRERGARRERCRRCWSASTGKGVLDTGTRARARAPGARAVPAAPALVRLEVARDPRRRASPTGRRSAPARTPAFVAMASVELHRRADGDLPPAAGARRRARRPTARSRSTRPACSPASPARARAPSSTASVDDDACNRLLGLIEHRRELPTGIGSLRGLLHDEPSSISAPERALGTQHRRSEQQRRVRERTVRVEAVPPRRAWHQSRVRVAGPPRQAGVHADRRPSCGGIFHHRAAAEPSTLAVVQGVVSHQGSGWDFTIDELRRYYEAVAARAREAPRRRSSAPCPSMLPPFSGRDRTLVPGERRAARPADRGDCIARSRTRTIRRSRPNRSAPGRARRRIAR